MIGKQTKGTGFGGLLRYLLDDRDKGAEIIGGSMLGENSRELSAEFSESRKLKPELKHAVYHTSLSIKPGEELTNAKWKEIADKYTNEMGFSGSQYVTIRHNDTKH